MKSIIEFRTIGEKIDEQSLKLFRTLVKNSYQKFCKIREQEECETFPCYIGDEYLDPDERENFFIDWTSVSLYSVVDLYSKLGFDADELLEDKKLKRYSESGCLEYPMHLYEVFDKIQSINDNVVFFYAVCLFSDCISESSKIYEHFIKDIHMGIQQYNLQEYKELLESNEVQESVFIAMQFSKEMTKARREIESAIKQCGYKPVLMDEKQHNNQIVPEMFFEIKKSKFVVADLTGNRGGVYYEAGYATALNKEVILTCKKNKQKPHFDVAQINIIFWSSEDEIKEMLVKRIEATIGKKMLYCTD